jgi:anthranilate phosphoribosyltransferase
LNSSAALVCGFRAGDLKDGVRLAAEAIDSGKALDKLQKLVDFTNKQADQSLT